MVRICAARIVKGRAGASRRGRAGASRRGRRQSRYKMLLSSYQTLIFVRVLSRDCVNYFYISIKLVIAIR